MLAARMIPALWFRLIVLLGFTLFMTWESAYIFSIIALLLAALTACQLRTAYRHRESPRADTYSPQAYRRLHRPLGWLVEK